MGSARAYDGVLGAGAARDDAQALSGRYRGLLAPPVIADQDRQRSGTHDGGEAPVTLYEPLDVTLRLFIPAPVVAFPQGGALPDPLIPELLYGLLGGDGRSFDATGGTHRCQVTFRVNPDPGRSTPFEGAPQVSWGRTRVYAPGDGQHVDGRPNWWWDVKDGSQPLFTNVHADDDTSLKVSAQLIADEAIWRIRFEVHAGIPLPGWKGALAPIIDASLTLEVRTRTSSRGGTAASQVRLWGTHDGFPAYEAYVDGGVLYRYSPETRPNAGPWNLYPPMDVVFSTPSSDLSPQPGFRPVRDLLPADH